MKIFMAREINGSDHTAVFLLGLDSLKLLALWLQPPVFLRQAMAIGWAYNGLSKK